MGVERVACSQRAQCGRHEFLGMRLHKRPTSFRPFPRGVRTASMIHAAPISVPPLGRACRPVVTPTDPVRLLRLVYNLTPEGQRFLRHSGLTHTIPPVILHNMLE